MSLYITIYRFNGKSFKIALLFDFYKSSTNADKIF